MARTAGGLVTFVVSIEGRGGRGRDLDGFVFRGGRGRVEGSGAVTTVTSGGRTGGAGGAYGVRRGVGERVGILPG